MKSLILWILIFTLPKFPATTPSGDFEGSITYQYSQFNSEGLKVSFPQDMETIHVSYSGILVQIISGQLKYVLGYDLLLDVDKHQRAEVYRDEKKIYVLGNEPAAALDFVAIDSSALGQVLNYMCTIKRLKHFDAHSKDTVQCTYYFNDKFAKSNLKEFAALQGNQNTLFLDGRFSKIPLKVDIRYASGKRILVEAVNVKSTNVESLFNFSGYEIHKK